MVAYQRVWGMSGAVSAPPLMSRDPPTYRSARPPHLRLRREATLLVHPDERSPVATSQVGGRRADPPHSGGSRTYGSGDRWGDDPSVLPVSTYTPTLSVLRYAAQFGVGWAAYQAGRCEESVDSLAIYLARHPRAHLAEARFAHGWCLAQVGRVQEASVQFEQLVSTFPGHSLALEGGSWLIEQYRHDAQYAFADAVLHRLWPQQTHPLARAQLELTAGSLALDQGDAVKARERFTQAMRAEDMAIQQAALKGLGDVALFLGDLTSAAHHYGELIALNPDSAPAHSARYQMGRMSLQQGDVGKAIAFLQPLALGAPAAVADEAQLAILTVYLTQHDTVMARALIAALHATHDAGTLFAARLAYYDALLALEDGDVAVAQQRCQDVIASAPLTHEAFEAHILLADLQDRVGQPGETTRLLKELLAIEQLPRAHRANVAKRLGDLARRAQDYVEAIRWYDEASALWPMVRDEARYLSASCAEEAGDIEVALHGYHALTHAPWRVRGQFAAAKLLERQGRMAELYALYTGLASEPIPEAKLAGERLAALHGEQ